MEKIPPHGKHFFLFFTLNQKEEEDGRQNEKRKEINCRKHSHVESNYPLFLNTFERFTYVD